MKTFIVKKPWGSFTQFTHNEKSTIKILKINPGGELSLQTHKTRKELWYIVEGKPTTVLNTKTAKHKEGDSIKVGKGVKHRIINKTKELVIILEIATGKFDENDIVRIKDKYNRIK